MVDELSLKKSKAMFNSKENGFSLVELIVVLIITAILAQLGFVAFKRYLRRTRAFSAKTVITNIKKECQANKSLGVEEIFTPMTLKGYQVQPVGLTKCSGDLSTGLVSAVPNVIDRNPTFIYEHLTGLVSEESYETRKVKALEKYKEETKFVELSPKNVQTKCEQTLGGTPGTGYAKYAIDGNPRTSWHCEDMTSITFDLGEKQTIKAINIKHNGNIGMGNYVKIYVDGKLVKEGSQLITSRGYFHDRKQVWEIEEIEGRQIKYESVQKPFLPEKDWQGNDYGDQRRNAKAVWTELAEISVDGYGALSNFETP